MQGAATLIRQAQPAEVCEAVKGQEVGVVRIVGAALLIVEGGAASGDDVLPVKQPVHILEAVPGHVGVIEQDATHFPVQQVGRGGERKGIADAAGVVSTITVENNAGQRPISLGLWIIADRELLGAARELDEAVAGSKEADLPSGEMRTMAAFSSGDRVCTRSTSTNSSGGGNDRVALQPGAHVAAIPGAVAGQEVAARPVRRIEQVRVHGDGQHPGAVVDSPGDRRLSMFHRAPEASGMFNHRHGRAMVFAVAAQQSGRAIGGEVQVTPPSVERRIRTLP